MIDGNRQFFALGAMVFTVLAVVTLFGRQTGESAALPAAGYLEAIETGADHIAPTELADALMATPAAIALVDLRPEDEFAAFHLPGAVRLTVPEVAGSLGQAVFAAAPRIVVLYSNGPAHAGQAWVELRRQGRDNVRVLAGGLEEFRTQLLLPPSLAADVDAAQSKAMQAVFRLRRAFFRPGGAATPAATWATDPAELTEPTVVSPAWVQAHLATVAVLDVRPGTDFGQLHLPGAIHLEVGSLRLKHGDRDLMLRPAAELAERFGALGLDRTTPVVLVAEDKMQDATLAALGLLRAGHRALAIVEGGILRWAAERRPLVAALAARHPVHYEPLAGADDFSIAIDELAAKVQAAETRVLDVRPPEFFRGDTTTEARAGHIPGAVNRPYQQDIVTGDDGQFFRSRQELEREFAAVGLATDASVTVSCRTGHTASESFFVLRYLLGYRDVKWFNGSWTQWAERMDLPAVTGGGQ